MTRADENRAARVFELSDPWTREDETPETIAETIETDPKAVIDFLLDIIENYTE